MVEIQIDGKTVSVETGASVIEAADQAGIYIPRFCYHKKLSIAANCRMCLVEVETMGKPMPACATPVTPGMVVYTQSEKALSAQRSVMEFLLINHPLDCPICDQGGECELQDLSLGFGHADSYYDESKRSVQSEDIGPLIETEMTRCIQCTRCVRFGEEVAGVRELGVLGRGENEKISAYVKQFVHSELSGNIIDLCPVGALTAKPSRYQGRGWEYQEHPSIAAHDAVGSNVFVHARVNERLPQREVMRVVPRENESINETWISDRDRFSYEGFRHESRVMQPRIKQNKKWVTVSWERALSEIADRTRGIIQQQGADRLAALASPNSTVEELYLLQKCFRALGSDNIDHRLRCQDFSDQASDDLFRGLNMPIEDIESCESILLVGSHVRSEQPLISQRIYKAYQDNATVMAINPVDYAFPFALSDKMIVAPQAMVQSLAEVAVALAQLTGTDLPELGALNPSKTACDIAKRLSDSRGLGKNVVLLGEQALNHPDSSQLRALARCITNMVDGTVGCLHSGANSLGACLAGAVPHQGAGGKAVASPGLDAKALLTDQSVDAYFLLNVEPEFDSAYSAPALKALNRAKFVVCLTTFTTPEMERYADFILPVAPNTETAGTFVNMSGAWQSFSAASEPHGEAKPAWKVLRVLANFWELSGFDHKTAHEVRNELQQLVLNEATPSNETPVFQEGFSLAKPGEDLIRLAPWHMYCVDNVVRRAAALQATISDADKAIVLHSQTAARLGLQAGQIVTAAQGDSRVALPLVLDDRLAEAAVLIPSGMAETAGFGQVGAPVTLQPEKEK